MPTVPGVGLGGSADGGEPGWEERVIEGINAQEREKKRKRGRTWDVSILIWFDMPYRKVLKMAADSRGMSISGYVRRATAAFISHDLGLPYKDIVRHTPYPAPHTGAMTRTDGTSPRDMKGRQMDNGTGFGDWILPEALGKVER